MKWLITGILCFLSAINLHLFARQPPAADSFIHNPLIRGYYADPTILVYNDRFYVYATIDPWGADSLALFVSGDLKNWQRKPLNWPTKAQCKSAQSRGSKVWAPSIVKGKDNKFHMFVAVGGEVYAGISNSPEGPWKNIKEDGSPFIRTQIDIHVHTIDAEIFMDDDGRVYLYWGSGWDWKDGHCYVAELNEQMNTLTGTPQDITPPYYFEAPYMLKRNGTYYLMYSDGKCTDSSYKVRYAISNNPFGPWQEGSNSPVLSTDMSAKIIGPGHHTVLHFGGKYYIIYHRIADTQMTGLYREICMDELCFDELGNIKVVHPSHTGVKNFLPKR